MNQRKYASQPRGGVNQTHVNGNIIFIYDDNYIAGKKKKKKQ